MSVVSTEFETFERQFTDIVGELQLIMVRRSHNTFFSVTRISLKKGFCVYFLFIENVKKKSLKMPNIYL